MIPAAKERRSLSAVWVFDVEDQYVREVLGSSPHPRPQEPLKFSLVGPVVGGAPAPLPEPLELVIVRNPSGYHLWFGEHWAIPEGASRGRRDAPRRRVKLDDGTYVLRVESPHYQTRELPDVALPMPNRQDPIPVDLRPGYAYPFSAASRPLTEDLTPNCLPVPRRGPAGPTLLRGSLHAADGRPVEGADVVVRMAGGAERRYRTDATGQWVLVFPDDHPTGHVAVEITPPGGAPVVVPRVCVVQGREMSLAQTVLRGLVQRDGIGVAGAEVQVAAQATAVATDNLGRWACYFPLDQADAATDVTATLPGGGPSQTQTGVLIRSRATSVGPTFRFTG